MRPSTQIKPVSLLKTRTAQVIRRVCEDREPLIITQNGEAKPVILDIQSYEDQQDTVALMKILALGSRQIAAGEVKPAGEIFERIRLLER
ncbi:MAG: type II toxin-antitoxin system Phd/YefM family antitoxin [Gammaproteobacteria bacterium]|jgi:prevent-host-death family protein|nr:type II toxin-antitoxin system Phd/YefM family antitoxin [Gammaproteobacteria bacterium]